MSKYEYDGFNKGSYCIFNDDKPVLAQRVLSLIRGRGWISVENRLPEINTDVLVYQEQYNGLYCVAFLRDDNVFISVVSDRVIFYPTHWQPLPNPPNNDK